MKKNYETFNTRQEMVSNTYEIFHYHDARKRVIPLHHHDFYEIYLFLNGQVEYRIDSNVYELKSTDILLFPPNTFHQPLVNSSKPYERIVLWINSKYLKQIVGKDNLLDCFSKSHILSTGNSFDAIQSMLLSIISENKKDDKYKDIYIKSVLISLLCELNRLSLNAQPQIINNRQNPTLNKILAYINDNYTYNIKLDDIAKAVYLDKYYLSHLFTKEVGSSIHQYIKKKRLVDAKDLLEKGYSPIEVSKKVGFGDYTNFYRAYKDEYNVSPKISKHPN